MQTFLQLVALFAVIAVGPLVVVFLGLTNSKSL